MIIPDECVPYIRYQRSRFIEAKVPDPNEVKRRYAAWVREDFENMEPHLPANVRSIIEVGCGMAGIQLYLKRKFPDATLTLLDGNKVTRAGGAGYSSIPDVYNSRAHTEALLAANGVGVDRWLDIGAKQVLDADLILSMASWGFHYPFATYSAQGFVIVDLRRRAEDNMIAWVRQHGKIIFNGPKYERCAFQWG